MMNMKHHLALFLILSCMFASQEASAPVLVENEPLHHVVLKNESVLVLHLTLPPGERTLFHTHTHDRVAVNLSSTSITQQTPNEEEGPPSPTKPGNITVYNLAGNSFTHRVHNIGSVPFDVLDVELLSGLELPRRLWPLRLLGKIQAPAFTTGSSPPALCLQCTAMCGHTLSSRRQDSS